MNRPTGQPIFFSLFFSHLLFVLIVQFPRDDPPAIEMTGTETEATIEISLESPLDPKDYCECDYCKPMMTKEESVCCKSANYLQAAGMSHTS